MLRKNAVRMIVTAMVMSATYIFAIDQYDTMAHEIEWLSEKTAVEGIGFNEIGIELKAVKYDDNLSLEELEARQEEAAEAMAHGVDCSRLCKVQHRESSKKNIETEAGRMTGIVENSGTGWNYCFILKNEEDIHYNSYYDLKITGESISGLDHLRNWGVQLFKKWKIKPQETIYFKGSIAGSLSEERKMQLKEELFAQLDAKDTNRYQDDLNEATCAYYGYTGAVKSYIKEENGDKTNVQLSFKYNELQDLTYFIIAFPFYNEPF